MAPLCCWKKGSAMHKHPFNLSKFAVQTQWRPFVANPLLIVMGEREMNCL
jgi:hypothetical protein